MKYLKQTAIALAICTLSTVMCASQDIAAFKIPDSARAFVFNLRSPFEEVASKGSTNAAPQGLGGLHTFIAKKFTTMQHRGVVTLTFFDTVVCRVQRIKGEEEHSSVMIVGEMNIDYPLATSVLVYGHSVRLADLSEKTFEPPTAGGSLIYNGEEALKKLKEMGLEPPEDMDPGARK